MICILCKNEVFELDEHHIIPISQGGSESKENKINICKDCHYKIHHPNWIQGDIEQFNEIYEDAIDKNIFSDGWGIIPNKISRDKNLIPGAKLLYAEISSLCASRGYCWANNSYFAKIFDVSNATISQWITQLEKYLIFENRTSYKRKIMVHVLNKDINRQENTKQPSRKAESSVKKTRSNLQEKPKHNNNNINDIKEKNINDNNIAEKPKSAYHLIDDIFKQGSKALTGSEYYRDPKECKFIKLLEPRYIANPEAFEKLARQFYDLINSSDKFWSMQPFTPSAFNSLYNRITSSKVIPVATKDKSIEQIRREVEAL